MFFRKSFIEFIYILVLTKYLKIVSSSFKKYFLFYVISNFKLILGAYATDIEIVQKQIKFMIPVSNSRIPPLNLYWF